MPFAPLPGTESPRRGLFVDRWGTLLEPLANPRKARPEGLAWIDGAVDALFRAQQAGWDVYLIGNESEVARGRLSDAAWGKLEVAMLDHLAAMGVQVVRSYACLEDPQEGRGAHRKPSVFLLPDTGVFYHALQFDGVRLEQSWLVGDSTVEIVAAERAGLHTIGVRTGEGLADGAFHVEPTHRVADLREAVEVLLSIESYVRP